MISSLPVWVQLPLVVSPSIPAGISPKAGSLQLLNGMVATAIPAVSAVKAPMGGRIKPRSLCSTTSTSMEMLALLAVGTVVRLAPRETSSLVSRVRKATLKLAAAEGVDFTVIGFADM